MKKILSVLVVGCALAVPAVGYADPSGSPVATTTEDDTSYTYVFKDDLLDGRGLDMNSALIKVRARGIRSNLIKPRASFVPELYKSVENL